MENLTPLIIESIELLLIGMGSVFTILTLLIFLITMSSKLLAGFEDAPAPASRRSSAAKSPGDDQELIAVISAAINSFKNRR